MDYLINEIARSIPRFSHHRPAEDIVDVLKQHAAILRTPASMLNFFLQLAAPPSVGGVMIILACPNGPEGGRYDGTFSNIVAESPTLTTVDRLIKQCTRGIKNITNVTVIDAFALQPNPDATALDPEYYSRLLKKLILAKQPSVIISCFKAGGRHRGFINELQHRGVGHKANGRCTPIAVGRRGSPHRCLKIGAFHPSYSVNRHPDDRVLKQLLLLQFAKAFGEWCGVWEEQEWMDVVRRKAKEHAEQYARDASRGANCGLTFAAYGLYTVKRYRVRPE